MPGLIRTVLAIVLALPAGSALADPHTDGLIEACTLAAGVESGLPMAGALLGSSPYTDQGAPAIRLQVRNPEGGSKAYRCVFIACSSPPQLASVVRIGPCDACVGSLTEAGLIRANAAIASQFHTLQAAQ